MNSEQLENFEQFWRTYPRKVGKGAARKFYERALRIATADEIITGLRSQLGYYATREQQFIPHAATWLNQERWCDEPQVPVNQNKPRTLRDAAADLRRDYSDVSWPRNTSRN